ncbi:MAG: glycosyltransferase [Desulfobacterales bacterium]|nr:glycosyltransferase [Desulfobacterales bacterium]
MRKRFGTVIPRVRQIVNKDNGGFAAANNQVLPLCRGRYLYYLNPDAKLTGPGLLAKCIRFMETHPEVGLAGTRMINRMERIRNRFPGGIPVRSSPDRRWTA